ncbi:MAG: hypothetical protein HPY52_07425 [Firmicutes bacterium]|nr:hypothetical protein [Bacillota bacterium]
MQSIRVGDLVMRKSYDGDVVFKVVALTSNSALLRGVDYRVMADAPLNDIVACALPDCPEGKTSKGASRPFDTKARSIRAGKAQ